MFMLELQLQYTSGTTIIHVCYPGASVPDSLSNVMGIYRSSLVLLKNAGKNVHA